MGEKTTVKEKTTIKVLIDGKVMTLSGYETEEYLQRVSFYLNSKIEELKGLAGYSRMQQETRSSLLALNIADDYFKAREQADLLQRDIEDKDKDAYDIRQRFVSLQMEEDKLRQQNDSQRQEIDRLRQEISRLKGNAYRGN